MRLGFIIIVIRNSQFLRRPYRLGVTAATFGMFVALQYHRSHALSSLLWDTVPPENIQRFWFTGMLAYGIGLIILQLLIDTLLAEYYNRHQLSLANQRIRDYASKIEELATSQERNRIAQEIHDALGHSLTALTVHLEAVNKLWTVDPTQARELFEEAQKLAGHALQDVRSSVSTMRNDPLIDQSLSEALESLLDEIRRTHTVEINSQISLEQPIPPTLKITVYRIMQEALTNILKHGEASHISLIAQSNRELKIMIQDNGRGFDVEQNTTGFGLQSMQERTRAQQGQIQIMTAPGEGCQIQLSFPLDSELSSLNQS